MSGIQTMWSGDAMRIYLHFVFFVSCRSLFSGLIADESMFVDCGGVARMLGSTCYIYGIAHLLAFLSIVIWNECISRLHWKEDASRHRKWIRSIARFANLLEPFRIACIFSLIRIMSTLFQYYRGGLYEYMPCNMLLAANIVYLSRYDRSFTGRWDLLGRRKWVTVNIMNLCLVEWIIRFSSVYRFGQKP